MKGTVFSVEEFSVFDGPGIRTSVFLKGCPLRCVWCHNPEGQLKDSEIVRSTNGCISCGRCDKYADFINGKKVFTDMSVKNCPMNLLRVCGDNLESTRLCSIILKNIDILEASGGGVTFSGGEPTMQSDFLMECLDLLDGKLHRAIQTCGYCNSEIFRNIISNTDYVLFDLKIIDDDTHKRYTGVSNDIILENFNIIANSNLPFIVRVPLIPSVTDTESNLNSISKLLKKHEISYVELLPYNKLAGGKYAMLGREYNIDFDENKVVDLHPEIFLSYGIKTNVL